MTTADGSAETAEPTPDGPVSRVLLARLEQQRDQLVISSDATRRGVPHGLHDLRVSMRRIRTALSTFGPFVDRSVTDPLRDELRWAAHELGEARDREVVTDRIEHLLSREPARLVVGPVASRVDLAFASAREERLDVVKATLDSERYAALLVTLDEVVADLPLTTRASKPARKQATKRVEGDVKRVLERAAVAERTDDERRHVEALHEVRKAAKRLRYAAEASRAVTGSRVRGLRKTAKQLQEVLGDHHDTWVTREALQSLAVRADELGESSFTFGRLHALEQCRADGLKRRSGTLIEALENLQQH